MLDVGGTLMGGRGGSGSGGWSFGATQVSTQAFQSMTIKKDGQVVGMVNFGIESRRVDGKNVKIAHIQDTVLQESARGQGAWKSLMPKFEAKAKKAGAVRITLETNSGAEKVWKALGFKQVGSHGATKIWDKNI